MHKQVTPLDQAKALKEYWSPKVISEVDDYFVKVAKLKGEFVWHSHENEDELFMILQGQLVIELEGKTVTLNAGEVYVVPKGVSHNPVAEEECMVMLFERKNTLHTGEVKHQKSRSIDEQLGTYSQE